MKNTFSLALLGVFLNFSAIAQNADVFATSHLDYSSDQEHVLHPNDNEKVKINAPSVTQAEELKEQLKKLRGDIEQLQFENSRINEKFVKFTADIELRISDLSKKPVNANENIEQLDNISKNLDDDFIANTAVNRATTKTETNKNTSISKEEASIKDTQTSVKKDASDIKVNKKKKKKAIQQQYQDAYSLLKAKDYKAARAAFAKFIQDNPNADLVGSSYYWLGETYFLRGEFDKAAVNYLKGYQSNTHGTRSPDNLLKLSKSLYKIEKRKEACTTLLKLKKEFPSASTSIKKQMEEDIKSLRCEP